MTNQNALQEKLRSIYFELISNVSNHSYDEILSMLALQLKELLHTKRANFYVYNNWNKAYEVTTKNPNNDDLNQELFVDLDIDFDTIIKRSIEKNTAIIDKEQIYWESTGILETCIIPLNSKYGPTGLLVLSTEKNNVFLSNELINLLRQETGQFLKIVKNYKTNKEREKKSKFLFDLTTRFYTSINKNDILAETTKALGVLYPNFTYYILLSQDYEADSTLPIKGIEYSDDATKRVSTQAFITGEVQLEDRIKGKNTCLYAPLRGSQGVYGVIQIITPQIVDFPKEEIEFISQFANVAGKAIENATLYQHSKHLVSDLKLINEATHQLNSNLKISEITTIVSKQIMDACKATQVGFIYYREESDGTFDILAGSTEYFNSEQGHVFAEYMLNQMNSNTEPIFSGDLTNEFKGLPYRSVMAIPMLHSGTIHGVITIMHEDDYFFSFENFKLMQSLIQHSTLALTNSILKDKLEKTVVTDYLTKLYSRNYLDDKIQMHMEMDEKGTLILFDIDDFKKVNDTYGHHVGDEVIIQVAKIITTHLGKDDIPARWGGEELAIYLPGESIDNGVRLAGQIRKQAENFTDPMITLSCGVSTWCDKSKDSVRDVFIRADKALYEAKKIGKNCVVKGNKDSRTLAESSLPDK